MYNKFNFNNLLNSLCGQALHGGIHVHTWSGYCLLLFFHSLLCNMYQLCLYSYLYMYMYSRLMFLCTVILKCAVGLLFTSWGFVSPLFVLHMYFLKQTVGYASTCTLYMYEHCKVKINKVPLISNHLSNMF